MTLACLKARTTLVEYAAAAPVLGHLAATLRAERALVREQIVTAGERVARVLSLPANPFSVSANEVRVVDVAGLLKAGPRLEIEVAPKFLGVEWGNWREDFFFLSMLSRHGRVLANERLGSSIGARRDLATLVARAMISMFWDNHRRPLRTYRFAQVTEFMIDGEVDPESIVFPSADGYEQRLVTYDRLNVFNAAVLAATEVLIREVRDPQTRRQLVRMEEVLVPQRVLRHARHRRVPTRARRWQSIHDLAVDVLQGFGIAYDSASVRAPGFVLNTWRVWEDLLTIALRLSWGGNAINAQRSFALGVRTTVGLGGERGSKTTWVTPDLTLRPVRCLADAKYKGRVGETKNRISEADLYEALAFASAGRQRQIVLLYPSVARGTDPSETGTTRVFEQVAVGEVCVTGMEVEVRGISRAGALSRFSDNIKLGITRAVMAENSLA